MTEGERSQFEKMTNQPELADLHNPNTTISTSQAVVLIMCACTLVGGVVLSLTFMEWRIAVGTVATMLGELITFAALAIRR